MVFHLRDVGTADNGGQDVEPLTNVGAAVKEAVLAWVASIQKLKTVSGTGSENIEMSSECEYFLHAMQSSRLDALKPT